MMKYCNAVGIIMPKLVKAVIAGDGWKESFNWVSLESAKRSNKPVMLVVTSPTCPICRALKAKIVKHDGIKKLSTYFAMVSAHPEDLPPWGAPDDIFHPDGSYVPRILFFDAKFNFLPEIHGAVASNQFYYGEPDNIAVSMMNALDISRQRQA